jgi:hypothetical protein
LQIGVLHDAAFVLKQRRVMIRAGECDAVAGALDLHQAIAANERVDVPTHVSSDRAGEPPSITEPCEHDVAGLTWLHPNRH